MKIEHQVDAALSRVAAAIGEPARTRILLCLMDGHARTSTELAVAARVSPSTASAHLNRLLIDGLIKVQRRGKHRFYNLSSREVANALEVLSVVAGDSRHKLVTHAPNGLRAARTCYDHIAGVIGVAMHDRFVAMGWLSPTRTTGSKSNTAYELTALGTKAFEGLGIDVAATRALRRRFAYACLDWSERRPHLAGALGAALLDVALTKRWVVQELDSRALRLTIRGQREMMARFALQV